MIIITGHKGFIGSYLTKKLDELELEYIGIDLKDGNDIVNCELPSGDIVIHLAAQAGVVNSISDPFTTYKTNTLGTVRLVNYYKDSKFIFASTGGAIQDEILSPYGLSKLASEEFIKLMHKNYSILRFPNVYGKNSRSVADKFLRSDITIYGDGSATRTYGYVGDIVDGIIKSIKWNNGLYKLGSNQNYSVLQIAEAVGKPIKFEEKRSGELDHSSLKKETPDEWNTTVDLLEYINYEK